jgi:formylglycine-generating enzyme required for sulfatase activity
MNYFVKKVTENIVVIAVSALTMTSCNIVRNDDNSDFWEDNNSYKDAFEMVKVKGGTFTMGCTDDEDYDWELPTHKVTLSDFYIGKYEVTQEEWESVMGTNPSYFAGENLPVEQVSWNMIVGTTGEVAYTVNGVTYRTDGFCYKLSQKTGGGANYRLPTEAEWEYAARGGASSKGYKYSGSNTVGNVAWYGGNSGNSTHQVGSKQANELGIYDMSGNVWEWCADWWGYYSSAVQTNPTGPSTGASRVIRGGVWNDNAGDVRVSGRGGSGPDSRYNGIFGFRVACSP